MARKIPRLDGRIEYDPVQADIFYTITRHYLPIRVRLFDIPAGSIVQITTINEYSSTRFLRWHNTYAFRVVEVPARTYWRDFLIRLNGSITIKIHAARPKFCYSMKYRIDERRRRPVMVRHEMVKMRVTLRERIEALEVGVCGTPAPTALAFPPSSLFALAEDSASP